MLRLLPEFGRYKSETKVSPPNNSLCLSGSQPPGSPFWSVADRGASQKRKRVMSVGKLLHAKTTLGASVQIGGPWRILYLTS
jgi:hypothetical protein